MGEPVSITGVVVTGSLLNVAMLVAGFLLAWLALRLLDVLTGFDFRHWLEKGSGDAKRDLAIAVYLAGRLVAVGLLVGQGIH